VENDQHIDDDGILRAVEAWIDDLARGDYDTAFARTRHDPYYQWTPDLIRRVIAGYGLLERHPSGAVFMVTPRGSAAGHPHYRCVERDARPPGALAVVLHDLPLNGEWSDLTVTFRVEPKDDTFELVLEEIHVF
jgi:hypothetical protein